VDISKLSPQALPTQQPETPPSKQRLSSEIESVVSQDLEDLEKAAAASGQADIRRLDVPGGLQILLAETRAALQLILELADSPAAPNFRGGSDATAADPALAARQIVELVLRALPEEAGDAEIWTSALLRVEAALAAGMQQSVSTVSNWRDVPQVVVDSVEQSAAFVLQALSEEMPNPLWLRPEWVGLAPRLERFWRRRRAARRRLTDPDHWQGSLDDFEQQR
jgi:hypothetical protein